MQAEGIFRINAENGQEEFVREQLNRGIIPDNIDVHCLAGLIKVIFCILLIRCISLRLSANTCEMKLTEDCKWSVSKFEAECRNLKYTSTKLHLNLNYVVSFYVDEARGSFKTLVSVPFQSSSKSSLFLPSGTGVDGWIGSS